MCERTPWLTPPPSPRHSLFSTISEVLLDIWQNAVCVTQWKYSLFVYFSLWSHFSVKHHGPREANFEVLLN